jgi:hypothetical protein
LPVARPPAAKLVYCCRSSLLNLIAAYERRT